MPISFAEKLQRNLDRLVVKQHQKKKADADGFWWPFEDAGFSPFFEGLLALNHRSRRRKKKPRAGRRHALQMGACFLALQERDSTKMPFSFDLRHPEGVDSAMPGLLMMGSSQASEASPKTQMSTHPCETWQSTGLSSNGWVEKAAMASVQAKLMMKEISVLERAQIGAGAGGIAGAITYACLHPLDTIKTKLQTRGASRLYSGSLDVIVKTFRSQGVLGFYNGISAVLVGSMLSSAVYFGICELGKGLLVQVPSLPAVAVPPIAGAFGNIASSAILVPKELITQRMQAGAQGRSWEVFLRTVESEGFKGLYTGYFAALVRNLPASVLSFSSFEYLKSAWMKKTGKNRLNPWQSVVSGALAGVFSSALTTPLDVVKTRLVTQARSRLSKTGQVALSSMAEAELQAKIAAATYEGITSTLKKIWLEEGLMGLTKGVVPRILYSACFSALGYFAFETARLALLKRHLENKKTGRLVSHLME